MIVIFLKLYELFTVEQNKRALIPLHDKRFICVDKTYTLSLESLEWAKLFYELPDVLFKLILFIFFDDI